MRLVRRYGIWVTVALLACVAGAYLVGTHRSLRYTSSAEVDVEASAIPNTVPVTINMVTEKDVASSGVVVRQAAAMAGISVKELSAGLSVSEPAGANLLSIGCTMGTAAAAQQCATAATTAYMDFRNETHLPAIERARDPWSVTLVTSASLPTKPSGLSKKILLSVGAFIGLLLGLGTAFVRDRLDDRVRDREDLEQCLDAAVIGTVPWVRRSLRPASRFSAAPASQAPEPYRYLRAHLDSLLPQSVAEGKVVLVTGAQSRSGRTSVAANVAAVLAQAGSRVLLVDADLRHPSLPEVFRVGRRPGLTEMLAGRASLGDVVVRVEPGLGLITAGEPERWEDLFDATRLTRVIKRLRAAADVVVIDSGPVLSVSDPIALALLSDLVMMVASVRRSTRTAVRQAALELRTSGSATIVGVLTGIPQSLLRAQPRLSQPAPAPVVTRARAHLGNGSSLVPERSGSRSGAYSADETGIMRLHRRMAAGLSGVARRESAAHRLPTSADENRF